MTQILSQLPLDKNGIYYSVTFGSELQRELPFELSLRL
jgi:hypothetical protein